ncbi:hypothetical protein FD50_GL001414 [Liquorilactobacillus satsumensis DSM 16230 = JCM 12392]|uniref:Uncharacterized protein n=1 Tax=Liquorilactobacillus satsumensis DSM 16230 = JCM 12392 TaxID=1423801 RepID=A0A0R1UW08_9LACO|nr:hypothetical protein FD50_GL001414 [Liquorilactobacillus satsumensis DSM 16230 = JCM 12392]
MHYIQKQLTDPISKLIFFLQQHDHDEAVHSHHVKLLHQYLVLCNQETQAL